MRLLCRVGLHYWKLLGFTNLLLSASLEECRFCGKGRESLNFGEAFIYHTPEQMAVYHARARAGRERTAV